MRLKSSACIVACYLAAILASCASREPWREAIIPASGTSIAVDTTIKVRSIPADLFGTNVEWAMNMQEIWSPEKGANQRVLELSKQMGVKTVRFPGGTGADYYEWKLGTGTDSKRAAQNFVISPGSAVNYFGTDELMGFCESISARPLLTVNLITQNAQNAADWVAYCNSADDTMRILNGHRAPYNVRLWELGNESYMKADKAETKASSLSASEYVTRCNTFIAAMRKVDPSIQIGAIGGNNFTRFSFLQDDAWNKTVIAGLGDKIDFLAVHNGYAPLVVESDNYNVEEVYASLLAFPTLMARNFKTLGDEIDQFGGKNASHIKIAVTEWAPLFHVGTTSRWVDHPKTLGSGLFAAGALHSMISNPRVCAANFFKLKDLLFGGTIGYNDVPKSSFYVLELYSPLAGQDLVECKVDCLKYNCRAIGLVPEIKDVPYLDVLSATSADGEHLSLYAINKSLSQPIVGRITLKGFVPQATAKVTTFTASNIDANNGKDIPDVPGYSWAKQAEAADDPQFYKGGPNTLRLVESTLDRMKTEFNYTFPAHSVTRLSIDRQ